MEMKRKRNKMNALNALLVVKNVSTQRTDYTLRRLTRKLYAFFVHQVLRVNDKETRTHCISCLIVGITCNLYRRSKNAPFTDTLI